jgi:uncharacterized membrane protein
MYQSILQVHILAGFASLVGGFLATVFPKGGQPHKQSGRLFCLAMVVVGITAIVLSTLKWNSFLLSISIFSLYLVSAGYQSIKYWQLKNSHKPALYEKLPAMIGFVTAIVMIAYPLWQMIAGGLIFFPLSMVFGAGMLVSTIFDFRLFRDKTNFTPKNKKWLFRHIGMMGGAYISTWTAFLVVNVKDVPVLLPWLGPTVIGSVIISLVIRKWAVKLSKTEGIAREYPR